MDTYAAPRPAPALRRGLSAFLLAVLVGPVAGLAQSNPSDLAVTAKESPAGTTAAMGNQPGDRNGTAFIQLRAYVWTNTISF